MFFVKKPLSSFKTYNMKRVIIISILILIGLLFYNLYAQNNYFDYATEKINKYSPPKKNIVIVVDYKKNMFSERLFILDMEKKEVIMSCKVSHAWNSGFLYPTSYSNEHGSNKSSKGNYITKGVKYGKFGYSMVIKGLDYGINNNAESRAVIFHSDRKMKTKWSNGCFATSESNNKKIIDLTKNGVLVCVID